MYGNATAGGGLLLIYTKSPIHPSRFRRDRPLSLATVNQLGYKPAVEFYVPRNTSPGEYDYVTVDVEFAGRKVRLFFTKRNKNSDWNALITTNTELEFKDAYRIYSMRWSLEVVFKDSKGNLGLGKYQVRNFASQIACTAITAIQCNILATVRRFSSYETIVKLVSALIVSSVCIWGFISWNKVPHYEDSFVIETSLVSTK